MSLRPFWKKHPVLLRVNATVVLVLSPVILPILMAMIAAQEAWKDRVLVVSMYRELWGYVIGRKEE